ncbi:MAG TPA: extracellular substrate binding-like orphan protein GrrP [Allocoleopsis sp.]
MMRKIAIVLLSLIPLLAFPGRSWAETVMEKVARTGVLTVGTRLDEVPYSYVNDQGQLVGYSIDVINLIKDQISKQLGKEILVQVVEETNFADRIPQLVSGQVDISCDTSFTWERDQFVDFSVSYGISGVRLAVPKGSSLSSPDSLVGKKIGVLPNTVAQSVIQTIQPEAVIVPVTDIQQGFTALKQGEVDALAGDTIVLAGEILRTDPTAYTLTPTEPYARYGVACMVPENNSSFLDQVNFALVRMMQGYVSGEASSVDLIDRWFGSEGIVTLPPELIRGFFQSIILTREQIPLETQSSRVTTP